MRVLIIPAVLACIALGGCSDPPPTGGVANAKGALVAPLPKAQVTNDQLDLVADAAAAVADAQAADGAKAMAAPSGQAAAPAGGLAPSPALTPGGGMPGQ